MKLVSGMMVRCLDNENIESMIKQNHIYMVSAVSHQGKLVTIKGVPFSLASTRFEPVKSENTPSELRYASNQ